MPAPFPILLVEDNPAHAELIFRSLAHHPIPNQIRHVTDGAAALDYLHRRAPYTDPAQNPRPHLILLDLRLPKISGLEVLKEIRQTDDLKYIPVVVLSTSKAEQDITLAYAHHANSYIIKPADYPTLTNLMRDLGGYWMARNHYPGR